MKSNRIKKFELIKKVIKLSKKSNLKLCHWKSNLRLPLSMKGISDFDFFIPLAEKKKLIVILKKMKFIEFFEPNWSKYPGVSDWVGIDFKEKIIYHIHLHTTLITGAKFLKEQNLPWLDIMIKNLIRDRKTNILIPKPEFEYLLLIIRESIKSYSIKYFIQRVFGKKHISKETLNEYNWLLKKSKKSQIYYFGDKLFGNKDWNKIKKKISFNFFKNELLFKVLSRDIFKSLKIYRSGSILSNSLKYTIFYIWFKISNTYENVSRNRYIGKRTKKKGAPCIAILGVDGAGKTSLAYNLVRFYGEKIDVEKIYLGSLKFKYLKKIKRYFFKKNNKDFNKSLKNNNNIINYIFAILNAYNRLIKLKKIRILNKKGITVITDRFPQNQFKFYCDGPSIKLIKSDLINNFFYNLEKFIINKYKNITPDLVIKINAPLTTLMKIRFNDSKEKLLESSKIIKKLKFNNVKMINRQTNINNIACREVWHVLVKKNL